MTSLSLLQVGLVGVAGAIGALTRYLLGRFFAERVSTPFPVGTFLINLSGAFFIGLLARLVGRHVVNVMVQTIAATGFLGGYTTFSTMQWESVQLIRGGSNVQGLLYVGGTFALGLLLAAGGWIVGGWFS